MYGLYKVSVGYKRYVHTKIILLGIREVIQCDAIVWLSLLFTLLKLMLYDLPHQFANKKIMSTSCHGFGEDVRSLIMRRHVSQRYH